MKNTKKLLVVLRKTWRVALEWPVPKRFRRRTS